EAIQVKLDELLRASEGAHNALLDLEELEEGDLDRIRARYAGLAERARRDLREVGPTRIHRTSKDRTSMSDDRRKKHAGPAGPASEENGGVSCYRDPRDRMRPRARFGIGRV